MASFIWYINSFSENYNFNINSSEELDKGFELFATYVIYMCTVIENHLAKDEIFDISIDDLLDTSLKGVDTYFNQFLKDLSYVKDLSDTLTNAKKDLLSNVTNNVVYDGSTPQNAVNSVLSSLISSASSAAINSLSNAYADHKIKNQVTLAEKKVFEKHDFKKIFYLCLDRSASNLVDFYCETTEKRLPKYKKMKLEMSQFNNGKTQSTTLSNVVLQYESGNISTEKAVEIIIKEIQKNIYQLSAYAALQTIIPRISSQVIDIIVFMKLQYFYHFFIIKRLQPILNKCSVENSDTINDISWNIAQLKEMTENYPGFMQINEIIETKLKLNQRYYDLMCKYKIERVDQVLIINGLKYSSIDDAENVYSAIEWLNSQNLILDDFSSKNFNHINNSLNEFKNKFNYKQEVLDSIPMIKKIASYSKEYKNKGAEYLVKEKIGTLNFTNYSFDNVKKIEHAKKYIEDWAEGIQSNQSDIGETTKPAILEKCKNYLTQFYDHEITKEIAICRRFIDELKYDSTVEAYMKEVLLLPEAEKHINTKYYDYYIDECNRIRKGTFCNCSYPIARLIILPIIIIACLIFISSIYAKIILGISIIELIKTRFKIERFKKEKAKENSFLRNGYSSQTTLLRNRLSLKAPIEKNNI